MEKEEARESDESDEGVGGDESASRKRRREQVKEASRRFRERKKTEGDYLKREIARLEGELSSIRESGARRRALPAGPTSVDVGTSPLLLQQALAAACAPVAPAAAAAAAAAAVAAPLFDMGDSFPLGSPGFFIPAPRVGTSAALSSSAAMLNAASLDVVPFLSDPSWKPLPVAPPLRAWYIPTLGVQSVQVEVELPGASAARVSELLWDALCGGGGAARDGLVVKHLARASASGWIFAGGAGGARASLVELGGLGALLAVASHARGAAFLPASAAAVDVSNALLEVTAAPAQFCVAARHLPAVAAPLLWPLAPPAKVLFEGVFRSVAGPPGPAPPDAATPQPPLAYGGWLAFDVSAPAAPAACVKCV
jgi:hypothetical protein